MRRWWVVVLLLTACTSAWQRHQQQLADSEAHGDYHAAVVEASWLVDNAFLYAPDAQRRPAADAARYLRLARVAGRAGNLRLAIEALRETLMLDPHQADTVRAELEHLPVDVAARERLRQEFAWNSAALAPGDAALVQAERTPAHCWSYRVREVRIRHRRTLHSADGMMHQVTYDARPWMFDAPAQRWRAEGAWIDDAGSEDELTAGPPQPRYRALIAAPHQFYADDTVPPCHRAAWQGPFDTNGTVFVTERLPAAP